MLQPSIKGNRRKKLAQETSTMLEPSRNISATESSFPLELDKFSNSSEQGPQHKQQQQSSSLIQNANKDSVVSLEIRLLELDRQLSRAWSTVNRESSEFKDVEQKLIQIELLLSHLRVLVSERRISLGDRAHQMMCRSISGCDQNESCNNGYGSKIGSNSLEFMFENVGEDGQRQERKRMVTSTTFGGESSSSSQQQRQQHADMPLPFNTKKQSFSGFYNNDATRSSFQSPHQPLRNLSANLPPPLLYQHSSSSKPLAPKQCQGQHYVTTHNNEWSSQKSTNSNNNSIKRLRSSPQPPRLSLSPWPANRDNYGRRKAPTSVEMPLEFLSSHQPTHNFHESQHRNQQPNNRRQLVADAAEGDIGLLTLSSRFSVANNDNIPMEASLDGNRHPAARAIPTQSPNFRPHDERTVDFIANSSRNHLNHRQHHQYHQQWQQQKGSRLVDEQESLDNISLKLPRLQRLDAPPSSSNTIIGGGENGTENKNESRMSALASADRLERQLTSLYYQQSMLERSQEQSNFREPQTRKVAISNHHHLRQQRQQQQDPSNYPIPASSASLLNHPWQLPKARSRLCEQSFHDDNSTAEAFSLSSPTGATTATTTATPTAIAASALVSENQAKIMSQQHQPLVYSNANRIHSSYSQNRLNYFNDNRPDYYLATRDKENYYDYAYDLRASGDRGACSSFESGKEKFKREQAEQLLKAAHKSRQIFNECRWYIDYDSVQSMNEPVLDDWPKQALSHNYATTTNACMNPEAANLWWHQQRRQQQQRLDSLELKCYQQDEFYKRQTLSTHQSDKTLNKNTGLECSSSVATVSNNESGRLLYSQTALITTPQRYYYSQSHSDRRTSLRNYRIFNQSSSNDETWRLEFEGNFQTTKIASFESQVNNQNLKQQRQLLPQPSLPPCKFNPELVQKGGLQFEYFPANVSLSPSPTQTPSSSTFGKIKENFRRVSLDLSQPIQIINARLFDISSNSKRSSLAAESSEPMATTGSSNLFRLENAYEQEGELVRYRKELKEGSEGSISELRHHYAYQEALLSAMRFKQRELGPGEITRGGQWLSQTSGVGCFNDHYDEDYNYDAEGERNLRAAGRFIIPQPPLSQSSDSISTPTTNYCGADFRAPTNIVEYGAQDGGDSGVKETVDPACQVRYWPHPVESICCHESVMPHKMDDERRRVELDRGKNKVETSKFSKLDKELGISLVGGNGETKEAVGISKLLLEGEEENVHHKNQYNGLSILTNSINGNLEDSFGPKTNAFVRVHETGSSRKKKNTTTTTTKKQQQSNVELEEAAFGNRRENSCLEVERINQLAAATSDQVTNLAKIELGKDKKREESEKEIEEKKKEVNSGKDLTSSNWKSNNKTTTFGISPTKQTNRSLRRSKPVEVREYHPDKLDQLKGRGNGTEAEDELDSSSNMDDNKRRISASCESLLDKASFEHQISQTDQDRMLSGLMQQTSSSFQTPAELKQQQQQQQKPMKQHSSLDDQQIGVASREQEIAVCSQMVASNSDASSLSKSSCGSDLLLEYIGEVSCDDDNEDDDGENEVQVELNKLSGLDTKQRSMSRSLSCDNLLHLAYNDENNSSNGSCDKNNPNSNMDGIVYYATQIGAQLDDKSFIVPAKISTSSNTLVNNATKVPSNLKRGNENLNDTYVHDNHAINNDNNNLASYDNIKSKLSTFCERGTSESGHSDMSGESSIATMARHRHEDNKWHSNQHETRLNEGFVCDDQEMQFDTKSSEIIFERGRSKSEHQVSCYLNKGQLTKDNKSPSLEHETTREENSVRNSNSHNNDKSGAKQHQIESHNHEATDNICEPADHQLSLLYPVFGPQIDQEVSEKSESESFESFRTSSRHNQPICASSNQKSAKSDYEAKEGPLWSDNQQYKQHQQRDSLPITSEAIDQSIGETFSPQYGDGKTTFEVSERLTANDEEQQQQKDYEIRASGDKYKSSVVGKVGKKEVDERVVATESIVKSNDNNSSGSSSRSRSRSSSGSSNDIVERIIDAADELHQYLCKSTQTSFESKLCCHSMSFIHPNNDKGAAAIVTSSNSNQNNSNNKLMESRGPEAQTGDRQGEKINDIESFGPDSRGVDENVNATAERDNDQEEIVKSLMNAESSSSDEHQQQQQQHDFKRESSLLSRQQQAEKQQVRDRECVSAAEGYFHDTSGNNIHRNNSSNQAHLLQKENHQLNSKLARNDSSQPSQDGAASADSASSSLFGSLTQSLFTIFQANPTATPSPDLRRPSSVRSPTTSCLQSRAMAGRIGHCPGKHLQQQQQQEQQRDGVTSATSTSSWFGRSQVAGARQVSLDTNERDSTGAQFGRSLSSSANSLSRFFTNLSTPFGGFSLSQQQASPLPGRVTEARQSEEELEVSAAQAAVGSLNVRVISKRPSSIDSIDSANSSNRHVDVETKDGNDNDNTSSNLDSHSGVVCDDSRVSVPASSLIEIRRESFRRSKMLPARSTATTDTNNESTGNNNKTSATIAPMNCVEQSKINVIGNGCINRDNSLKSDSGFSEASGLRQSGRIENASTALAFFAQPPPSSTGQIGTDSIVVHQNTKNSNNEQNIAYAAELFAASLAAPKEKFQNRFSTIMMKRVHQDQSSSQEAARRLDGPRFGSMTTNYKKQQQQHGNDLVATAAAASSFQDDDASLLPSIRFERAIIKSNQQNQINQSKQHDYDEQYGESKLEHEGIIEDERRSGAASASATTTARQENESGSNEQPDLGESFKMQQSVTSDESTASRQGGGVQSSRTKWLAAAVSIPGLA